MKKAKKALLLVLCAALLVSASVMGTVAYLTDKEVVNNTFTVGDVVIYMDETDIDGSETTYNYDKLLNEGRDLANKYEGEFKLIPGRKVTKDPTVWVKEGSEDAYIRMIVTVNNYDQMLLAFNDDKTDYDNDYIVEVENVADVAGSGKMVVLDKMVDRDSSHWQCVKFTQNETAKTGTYEFRYYPGVYTAAADDNDADVDYDRLPALFTTITVPKEIDNTHLAYLNNTTITVEAHAIQADGFANADAAWTAFNP